MVVGYLKTSLGAWEMERRNREGRATALLAGGGSLHSVCVYVGGGPSGLSHVGGCWLSCQIR